ncbi:MAG: lysophospholipid acyltransferase family protein [Planctomycetota bacterium]
MGKVQADDLVCRLELTFKGKLGPKFLSLVGRPFERLLRFERPRGFYIDTPAGDAREESLVVLNVALEVSEDDLARIPAGGPAVAVCNHPFGGIEALILGTVLRSVREDVKVVAGPLLERMSANNESFIRADPFGRSAPSKKLAEECTRWVGNGGLLAVHPAADVPDIDLKHRVVADPRWRESVARFIREAGAPVLPIFISGCNEALFHIVGLVQYRLSSAVEPGELFNRQRKDLQVRVGSIVPVDKLGSFESDTDLIAYLRMRTYILDGRSSGGGGSEKAGAQRGDRDTLDEIAPPRDPEQIEREVQSLPPEQTLAETGGLVAILADAPQIPNVMHEIGRLREVTFREVGEGTGKSLDLDRFDEYYKHLLVWNTVKGELVGAYRLGLTDEILARFGKDGLYTSTLFEFKSEMLEKINPAVELGRSFVRAEYQRSYAPLMLLWKGIGEFAVRNPGYKLLFGPVSINKDYNSTSRQLMMWFLKENNYMQGLAELVQARTPVETAAIRGLDGAGAGGLPGSIEEVSALVSEIESDQKGVPILLRQYLRLGGKLLGCNIDPEFSNVLDALLLVDLMETDRKILVRYMGREKAEAFLAYHGACL